MTEQPRRIFTGFGRLFFNHADAWGLTLIISGLCLVLHGELIPANLPLLMGLTAVAWFAFAFNDFRDSAWDALDPAKRSRNFFVLHRGPRTRNFMILTGVCIAIYMIVVAVAYNSPLGLAYLALAFGAIWAYSAPPLRLKRRPIFDLATHAVFVQTSPYLTPLALLTLPFQPADAVLVAILLVNSLGAQLEQQIRDFEWDRVTEGNFTTWIGQVPAGWLLRIVTCVLTGVVVYAIFSGALPKYLVPFALIGMPLILHRFVRDLRAPRSEWLVRISLVVALSYAGLLFTRMVFWR